MIRSRHTMPRRTFVRSAAAGLATVPFLSMPGMVRFRRASRVAVVRTADRREGVAEALRLLAVDGMDGKQVIVKPNFNSADATPGSTHNDVLSQIVREMQERGARGVTVGESSGPGNTKTIMERKGVFDLATEERFDVINFDEMPDDDWTAFDAKGTHWPEGFHLPRQVVDAEYLVSTCCLKTHGAGGVFTMSLKLSVGLTPKPERGGMHRSFTMRQMISELNTGYRPQLIVLDGVDAFTDGGPAHGELKQGNVIIAGDDRVAVDATGLAVLKELGSNPAIMRYGVFEQEQMARAVQLGLGASGPSDIEFVTGDTESAAYAATLEGILAQG
jgi:uncharacterized protein (DUF362 family)